MTRLESSATGLPSDREHAGMRDHAPSTRASSHQPQAADLRPLEDRIGEAYGAHQAGHAEIAEQAYRRILSDVPQQVDVLFLLSALLQASQPDQAAELARRAVQFSAGRGGIGVSPGSLHDHYAQCLARTGSSPALEIEQLKEAVRLEPGPPERLFRLADAERRAGLTDAAAHTLAQYLGHRPDDLNARTNLGALQIGTGALADAIRTLKQVIARQPDHEEALLNLALALKRFGQEEASLDAYRQALKASGSEVADIVRRAATPPLLLDGLDLDSAGPIVTVAAPALVSLPGGAVHPNTDGAGKKLRIALIYPPPWKLPPADDLTPGMPFGPPDAFNNDNPNDDLDEDFRTIPYGLLTLAAEARQAGHEVSIHNLSVTPWNEVVRLISTLDADFFGLSAFTANRRGLGALSELIRQHHPTAHIAAGGPFVTALPAETLHYYRAIDTAVIGEGETTFIEMLDAIAVGKSTRGIAGTAWRQDEAIAFGPGRARIKELDALASPFDHFTSYIVMTSRGCPSKCTFCGSITTWGTKLRFHSAEACIDIFRQALARLPVPFIAVKDDTFTAHRKRTLAVCDAIAEQKLNFLWSCDTRVDSLDDEMLRRMRLAGCQMISLGIESGSPEVLRTMRKDTTPETMLAATLGASQYGIHVRHYQLVLNRGEPRETRDETVKLIRACRPETFMFYALAFYPGTEDWTWIGEQQGLKPDIFFRNAFRELTVGIGRDAEVRDLSRHLACEIGAFHGFSYSVEEREAVVALLPDLHCAHVELANAYCRAGRPDDADRALDRATALGFPITAMLMNQRACIALERNRPAEAIALLEGVDPALRCKLVQQNLDTLKKWLPESAKIDAIKPLLNDSVLAIDYQTQRNLGGSSKE